MSSINRRIEKIREDLGITKTEFAKKIGISQQVYSNYSNGRDIPSSVLQQICKLSGVDANYLLLGEDAKQSDALKIPFRVSLKIVKTINTKLNGFPQEVISAFIYLLEQEGVNRNIYTVQELLDFLENIDAAKELDKQLLIKYVFYFLDDDGVGVIFLNKDYYIKYFYFLQRRKK